MTSASVPVSSTPASSKHSFLVHLQSLTGFSHELRTQVEGIGKPADQVAGMSADPPAFGPFGEATTLTTRSQAATAQMEGLIGDVRQAMQFADEVTRTVATGYREADDDVAWGIGGHAPIGTVVNVATAPLAGAIGTVGSAVGGVTAGLTNVVDHTLDGVGRAVGGVGGVVGVVQGVGGVVQGVADVGTQAVTGVAQTTGSILGALTGAKGGL